MEKCDILIIGAGVIGTAIARELSRYELDIKVIEKEVDVGFATSKANSGIVHAGFDDKPGTLKSKLVVEGNFLYQNWCEELSVPFKRIGSLVVAANKEGEKIIEELYKRGIENKVKDMKILKKEEILSMEPNLTENVSKALYAPSAGVTSPYELTIAQFENAKENGVDFKFESEVKDIDVNKKFNVKTKKGKIVSSYIINCAGVFADKISYIVGIKDFKIKSIKGEYYLCDKEIGNLINHIIFPVPTKISKGILVAPTVEGNLFFGPDAKEVKGKEDTSTTSSGLKEVFEGAKKLVPSIQKRYIITNFSGLRADAGEDFIIKAYENVPHFINVAGIKSPGLTCVPSIAKLVIEILKKQGVKLIPQKNFKARREEILKFRDLSFSQIDEIIKNNSDYGEIVCRCENVSVFEVKEAIRRGATTLDGVKYRARCGMGRCQGGFCTPKVLKILKEELKLPLEKITKKGGNSYLVYKETKN